jgi:hypothetical protein
VIRIHNATWVRTLCSLVSGHECFGGAFWFCPHGHLLNGGIMSWPKPWYPPVRLHGLITQKTIILNLNVLHFPALYHCFKTSEYTY